jgi:hypothetical protein
LHQRQTLLQNDLMKSPLVEANKIPGLHYAVTNDGIELPIVDVTHPAFALSVTDTEQRARVEKFLQEKGPFAAYQSSFATGCNVSFCAARSSPAASVRRKTLL